MIVRLNVLFVCLLLLNSANAQISFINIHNKSSSESEINLVAESNQNNRSSVICFLDTADIGYKTCVGDLEKKSQEFSNKFFFIVVKINSRNLIDNKISFFGYDILESQFFIKSELFHLDSSNDELFDNFFSKLPADIKKVDLSKCLKDKKMRTLLSATLYPLLDEVALSIDENFNEIVLLKKISILELNIKELDLSVQSNQHRQDSLNKLLTDIELQFKVFKNSSDNKNDYKPHSYLWIDENLKLNYDILGSCYRRIVIGLNLLDSDSLKIKISANFGVQKSADCWRGNYVSGIERVDFDFAQPIDELVISNSILSENYSLNSVCSNIGFDIKKSLSRSKMFVGFRVNFLVPIVSHLNFENMEGGFNYVGVLNSIQEPLTNIPDLGLVSNVSYVGYKGELDGTLKPYGDVGVLLGLSLGKKAPFDLNFSLGYITAKKFDLEQTNSAISSSYGNYNSLLTVNNSQVIIPGYLNFGIGIRKYLN